MLFLQDGFLVEERRTLHCLVSLSNLPRPELRSLEVFRCSRYRSQEGKGLWYEGVFVVQRHVLCLVFKIKAQLHSMAFRHFVQYLRCKGHGELGVKAQWCNS